uniref:Resistance protein n=1 Tax=Geladintestivirus 2 TaxID=3233134 RepID=A0AAU8MIQ3_9CAUD
MNIFNIEQDLLSIFNTIEENDGELTPELEEQLNITQEQFKDKIKSYTNVIKYLTNDINVIKKEKDRLNALQKSKEKTIDRLKDIIIKAVDMFGDTNKSGSKFVDYGVGKVSIRTSDIVNLDNESLDRFGRRLLTVIGVYEQRNQIHEGLVDCKEVLDYINSSTPEEESEYITPLQFDEDDTKNMDLAFTIDTNYYDLISNERGLNLMKTLATYPFVKVNVSANKNDIKRIAKESHILPIYAKLEQNKTLTIK